MQAYKGMTLAAIQFFFKAGVAAQLRPPRAPKRLVLYLGVYTVPPDPVGLFSEGGEVISM